MARHKSREQDPPPAYNRLGALTYPLNKRAQIRNQVAGAAVLLPTYAASQEDVADLAQRVVVARARAPRDAVVRHGLVYLGS